MRNPGIVLYFIGLAFAEALRLPRRYARFKSRSMWRSGDKAWRAPEIAVLLAISLGMWVLPGIYAFTDRLDSQSYTVPGSLTWGAAVVFVLGLVLRWTSQRALAGLWSGTLELADDHRLITRGVYAYVRHPLYASMILWALCQPILLPNAIAGFGGIVAVSLLWAVRVPREEAMMLKRFGEEYSRYTARTGRIFPGR